MCLACHTGADRNHEPGHAFGASDCTPCHGGDPQAAAKEGAHRGLAAFPGNLDNAARTCGACHPAQLQGVTSGPMATLRGMIASTRRAFRDLTAGPLAWTEPAEAGGPPPGSTAAAMEERGRTGFPPHPDPQASTPPEGGSSATPVAFPSPDSDPAQATVADLGHSPADSLLRKLCVSCHLGQPKTRHALDAVRDRGGGCLACHVNDYPTGAHPRVSARVRDERCFGCHSRSSRISLAYAGLAEVDEGALERADRSTLGRLSDGRLVESLPADVHHRAGLGCVDCHRGAEVMNLAAGGGARPGASTGSVDGTPAGETSVTRASRATCEGCHGPTPREPAQGAVSQAPPGSVQASADPALSGSQAGGGPAETQNVPVLYRGLRVGPEGVLLSRKLAGGEVSVPRYRDTDHPLAREHARLSCAACHSQWAPQCYGCHLSYDAAGEQWDHRERRVTPGRWEERRWDTRNGPSPLGPRADGRITPFAPGMLMTVQHPAWEGPMSLARFAAISPHTTGRARPCESCHPQSGERSMVWPRPSGQAKPAPARTPAARE